MRLTWISTILFLLAVVAASFAQSGPDSVTVIYKDGHQRTISLVDVSRIEFKDGAIVFVRAGHPESINISEIEHVDLNGNKVFTPGRNHFVGKWEVGVGVGGGKFFITLEPDGQARKTLGTPNGTWTLVNGEARISWDDGWHDIIRKVGEKHQKCAFEPGKSFDDQPSNVSEATNTTAQPI